MRTNVTQTILAECQYAPGEYAARVRRAGRNPATKAAQYALTKLPLTLEYVSNPLCYARGVVHDRLLQTGLATLLKAGIATIVRVHDADGSRYVVVRIADDTEGNSDE